jgi:osmoprotectant transport system permease protein
VGEEEGLIHFAAQVVSWLTTAAHWHGADGIPMRTLEHLELSGLAMGFATALAIPAGVLLGHVRRGGLFAISIVNIGRAIPSFAIVAVALPITISLGLGLGFWPTFLAVFLLALPPMFTNAYTAIRGVDAQIVDAARGMGLRERQLLFGVELPLGAPVIMAAVRVAAVQIVATVPLGALVGWGGLGRYIIDGLAQFDMPQVFVGALLVAVLAVLTEVGIGLAERVLLPAGVRRLSRAEAASTVV